MSFYLEISVTMSPKCGAKRRKTSGNITDATINKSTTIRIWAHLWPSGAEEVRERTGEEEGGWRRSQRAGCGAPSPWQASSPRWADLLQPLQRRTGWRRRRWTDWSWRDGRRRRRRRWRRRTRKRRSVPSSLDRSETGVKLVYLANSHTKNKKYFNYRHFCCNKCFLV